MTRYFATCARGLEPVLAGELTALGADAVEPGRGGVAFRGAPALLYRACLWLRTAVRVLRPVHEFEVQTPDELYEAVRGIDWNEWMTPDHTLAVDCNVRDSALTHSQYAARRVKDAICDQFRDRTGRRPSVDTEQPMIGLNLHVSKNRAILSLDSSWSSLHKRGYRPIQTVAPLNEALAAGLLLRSGWTGTTPLVDPLCGSGTFCIEGAWIALNRPPGLTRKWYAFQGWPDFDRRLWNAIRDDARRAVRKDLPAPISGSDVRQDVVELARSNARGAGVGNLLKFERLDVKDARPPSGECGTLICNPPYGERLGAAVRPGFAGTGPRGANRRAVRPGSAGAGPRPSGAPPADSDFEGDGGRSPEYEEKELIALYERIGEVAARYWRGWQLFVFTSNTMLAKKIGLKVVHKEPFFNGALECFLWEFRV